MDRVVRFRGAGPSLKDRTASRTAIAAGEMAHEAIGLKQANIGNDQKPIRIERAKGVSDRQMSLSAQL